MSIILCMYSILGFGCFVLKSFRAKRQCLHLRWSNLNFDPRRYILSPRSGTKLRVPEFRNALTRSGIIAHSKRHVETHP